MKRASQQAHEDPKRVKSDENWDARLKQAQLRAQIHHQLEATKKLEQAMQQAALNLMTQIQELVSGCNVKRMAIGQLDLSSRVALMPQLEMLRDRLTCLQPQLNLLQQKQRVINCSVPALEHPQFELAQVYGQVMLLIERRDLQAQVDYLEREFDLATKRARLSRITQERTSLLSLFEPI